MSYTTIEVFCQDAGHRDTRWLIDEFAKTGPGEWLPLEMLGVQPQKLWRAADAHGVLDVGSSADLSAPFTGPVTVRDRHKLVCRRCKRHGRRVRPVEARGEQLGEIFDVLARNGWTAISLSALAGRLARSAGG